MEVPEHQSLLSAELIAAYRAARYRVEHSTTFVLAVDVYSAELAALMRAQACDCAAYLTAWNPLGEEKARAENDARQARLFDELRHAGLRLIEGFGTDPTGAWKGEASVLVLELSHDAACEIGRRYGQNAILWSGADATPHLLLLR